MTNIFRCYKLTDTNRVYNFARISVLKVSLVSYPTHKLIINSNNT